MKIFISSILISLLFVSCAHKETKEIKLEQNTNKKTSNKQTSKNIITHIPINKTFMLKNKTSEMKYKLNAFYHKWKNTRYRYGGNSKRGIDCSAFTQRFYKEKFGKKIPRTTITQVKVGKRVSKSNLKEGDLVFFRTGIGSRHVGLYMGDGTFLHASIKGVKFTKINKNYYKKNYWTARRILK